LRSTRTSFEAHESRDILRAHSSSS
jgi:hypothetical protein